MTTYTAFKYNETHETEDLFTVNEKGKAIALAIGGDYDEVVNDSTGEAVWTKEKGVVSMENIYDIMVVGGTYHNDNGKDYIILAFDKDADVAIFLNPENSFTPYVGAKFVRFGNWGSGHYFKTLQKACDWFNHENDSEDENNPEGNFCVGTAYDNGSGEFFVDKKSTMEEVGRIIDELLEKDSDADIEISIDLV